MNNIEFACISNDVRTDCTLVTIDSTTGKIIDRNPCEGVAEATELARTKYGHDLTVGECYANFAEFKARNK